MKRNPTRLILFVLAFFASTPGQTLTITNLSVPASVVAGQDFTISLDTSVTCCGRDPWLGVALSQDPTWICPSTSNNPYVWVDSNRGHYWSGGDSCPDFQGPTYDAECGACVAWWRPGAGTVIGSTRVIKIPPDAPTPLYVHVLGRETGSFRAHTRYGCASIDAIATSSAINVTGSDTSKKLDLQFEDNVGINDIGRIKFSPYIVNNGVWPVRPQSLCLRWYYNYPSDPGIAAIRPNMRYENQGATDNTNAIFWIRDGNPLITVTSGTLSASCPGSRGANQYYEMCFSGEPAWTYIPGCGGFLGPRTANDFVFFGNFVSGAGTVYTDDYSRHTDYGTGFSGRSSSIYATLYDSGSLVCEQVNPGLSPSWSLAATAPDPFTGEEPCNINGCGPPRTPTPTSTATPSHTISPTFTISPSSTSSPTPLACGTPACTGSWNIVGNGSVVGPGEIQLTADSLWQTTAMWSDSKMDLTQNWTAEYDLYFGTKDVSGADGIVFVLHNDPRGLSALGDNGIGLGYANVDGIPPGITPSLAIEFDTWQNNGGSDPIIYNDPVCDHISAHVNANGIEPTGPTPPASVQASATSCNIEDGLWHRVRIDWTYTNASSQTIQIYFDGILRYTYTDNFIANVFGGQSCTFWGFTAGTGGASNLQKVREQACFSPTPTSTTTPSTSETSSATFTVTSTSTPSTTQTATQTETPTYSPTATNTLLATPTLTVTKSSTPTTSTSTPSPSRTTTLTATQSFTDTPTPTLSATVSETQTSTPSITPSHTPSTTSTASPTITHSPTRTPSKTVTRSPTQSATPTATSTLTATSTASSSATRSPSPTITATRTHTTTVTSTATPSATFTATLTATGTSTSTATYTSTQSFTLTPSSTSTFTTTRSSTWSPTGTSTNTSTVTPTLSPSATVTATFTATLSWTATPTYTVTSTKTPSPSVTPTSIPMLFSFSLIAYNSAGEQVKELFNGKTSAAVSEIFFDTDILVIGSRPLEINFNLVLSNFLSSIVWNGDNDNGQTLGGGTYTLVFESKDRFGKISTLTRAISVLNAPRQSKLVIYNSAGEGVVDISLNGFSIPIIDFKIDQAVFSPVYEETSLLSPLVNGPVSGGIQQGSGLVITLLDNQGQEHIFEWNGSSSAGGPVQSGTYIVMLKTVDQSNGVDTKKSVGVTLLRNAAGPGKFKVLIAPNPAVNKVTVYYGSGSAVGPVPLGNRIEVSIYNLAGELITKQNDFAGFGSVLFNVNALASGVYLVIVEQWKAQGLQSRSSVKFVILH